MKSQLETAIQISSQSITTIFAALSSYWTTPNMDCSKRVRKAHPTVEALWIGIGIREVEHGGLLFARVGVIKWGEVTVGNVG